MPKILSTDKPIDKELKVVKDSDGKSTSLEVSTEKIRVKNLEVSENTFKLGTHIQGDGTDLIVKSDGDINVETADGDFVILDNSDRQRPTLTLKNTNLGSPHIGGGISFDSQRAGATAGQDADIVGTITWKGYNDAGTPEQINYAYIWSMITDASDGTERGNLDFYVQSTSGNGLGLSLKGGDVLNEVDVDIGYGTVSLTTVNGNLSIQSSAGFDKKTATFGTSAEIEDGNDSTDVDFRLGNKYELTLTDDISGSSEFINLIFPAVSGNFILVLIQGNASCTVASAGWVAYAHDESECDNLAGTNGTDGAVRWAGGTAPTLTTTQYKSDIISIYWDADNQTAFATASLNF